MPKTSTRDSDTFKRAKAFSDFLGMHVRFQFLVLAAFFISAPTIITWNDSLRNDGQLFPVLDPLTSIVVTVLLGYAVTMLVHTIKTGVHRILRFFAWSSGAGIGKYARRLLAAATVAVFVAIEALLNGAIAWEGFGRVLPVFGVEMSEIAPFGERIWQDSCFFWQSECLTPTATPLSPPEQIP